MVRQCDQFASKNILYHIFGKKLCTLLFLPEIGQFFATEKSYRSGLFTNLNHFGKIHIVNGLHTQINRC